MEEKNVGGIAVEKEPKKPTESAEEELLTEFEQEQLEDFHTQIQHIVDQGHDSDLRGVKVEYLGDEEHRLYKLFRKFAKENWPDIRLSAFEKEIKHYRATVVDILHNEKGHNDPKFKTKNAFCAYLSKKELSVFAQHKEDSRKAA